MGGGLLSKPWREMPVDYNADLCFVKEFQPPNKEVKHVRILLLGPTGAGKSAFINSVNSVVRNRITSPSLTDASPGESFTKKYTTYKMWKNTKEYCSFVFNDTMGLESTKNGGVCVDDVKLVLKGHVKDGFQFNPERAITEEDRSYNATPTFNDRVQVLVSVIPADKVELLPDSVVEKMREIRFAATDLGIPQMAILTNVGEACEKVKKKLNNAYYSKILKEKVENFSRLLGLPTNCIFLVQNYHSETALNQEINALILFALRQMVTFGEDFINKELGPDNTNVQQP